MKKIILSLGFFLLCLPFFLPPAFAAETDTVRVGLYFNGSGSNGALVSANLENYRDTADGYEFGYYRDGVDFVRLGATEERKISMSQDINLSVNSDGSYTAGASGAQMIGCYHLQLDRTYRSYDEAASAAAAWKDTYGTAFPAYDNGTFYVRLGSYTSRESAEAALAKLGGAATVSSGSSYTVTVTITGTTEILFEYDDGGSTYLGVRPKASGADLPQTWFKGYRYYGGFEYDRASSLSGGKLNVINVVGLEEYVKGVITFEMSPSWPAEALKAQAVCARTYALYQHKHDSRNFNVCSTTNCQVYGGVTASKAASDAAVEETAGLVMYYDGAVIEADYHASNGGATESSENVWTAALPYLRGKKDPYESTISIANYSYEKSYTTAELTTLLNKKGYTIGTVASVQPAYTDVGNIASITFTDTAGKSVTVKKENCRLLLSAPSMHFTISSGSAQTDVPVQPDTPAAEGRFPINRQDNLVSSVQGLCAVSGGGAVTKLDGDLYVLTSSGKAVLGSETKNADDGKSSGSGTNSGGTSYSGDVYVVKGAGNGHNVGMSQYGANAMAKAGQSFRDILTFYYTDITIE